ncbi:hypothetical protein HU200_039940 [Digitaria exilis]|uniref:DUF8039 domain-containing protein n=1 Tax=Digitaria exilis TaxID=1010633 RepID=A0A835BBB2_9POAL|nr:hypothetical protein HU200_039940 [Digitaria exilis]
MYGSFTRCDDCALTLDAIDPLTQTPRRPKMSELPNRVAEYPLKRQNLDTYRDWVQMRKQQELQRQQEPEDEEPEEREPETSESAVGEQEDQMVTATNDEEVDADTGDASDDEEVPRSRTHVLSPRQIAPRTPRWIVYKFVRDGGDHFYHNELLRVLDTRYRFGRVGVEYRSEWWTHVHYRSFWRTAVHVRVTDEVARAAREISVHYAMSDRDAQEAGITDAARQAYHVYRHKCFAKIKDEPERYHPRRKSGATACTIASTANVQDSQLASTVALVATLNTEFDAVSDENAMLRRKLTAMKEKNEELQHHPEYRGESPQRRRSRYNSPAAHTTNQNQNQPATMEDLVRMQTQTMQQLTQAIALMQQNLQNPPVQPPPQPIRDRRGEFLKGRPPKFSRAKDPMEAEDWIKAVPIVGGVVHGVPIPPGYAKVNVDRVFPGWEDLDLEIEGGDGEKVLGQANDPQTPPDQIHQQPAQMEPPPPPTKDKDAQPAGTDPSEKKEAWEKAPKKPPPVPQKPASPPSQKTTPEMTRKQFTA